MVRKTLQQKAEESVYEAIDIISDELGIENNYYPEVYYLHRGFPFERLGIPENQRYDFESSKKSSLLKKDNVKVNTYLFDQRIILVTNFGSGDIAEEAGHYLHYDHSKIEIGTRDQEELIILDSLVEMFGFFCSKLVDPSRENDFSTYPDIINHYEKCLKEIREEGYDPIKFQIYQQGYKLGEELFNSYISGEVPMKKIRNLLRNPFAEENESIINFVGLKNNMVNFINKNY